MKEVVVLIVEDNEADADLIKTYLSQSTLGNDYVCIYAGRLEEALEKTKLAQVDVAILDLNLPDSEGLGTFNNLYHDVAFPIIISSGLDDEPTALKAVQSGAQDYLIKDELTPRVLDRALSYAMERHSLNQELREARKTAEQANETKSQFLAMMSHEFRTPLNGIISALELIRDDTYTEQNQEFLHIIDKSAHDLLTLINDLLDISKIEAGKLRMNIRQFSLQESVDFVLEFLKPKADEKGIELLAHVDEDVLDVVYSDPRRLNQVLINLVGNAIKFTEFGEVSLRVKAGTKGKPHFEVKDSGIGIDPSILDNIFEPFIQADSSNKRSYEGTGLGLAICKRLVALLGGEMCVESQLRIGSTFHFTISNHLDSSELQKREIVSKT